jgi:hypothetical protein
MVRYDALFSRVKIIIFVIQKRYWDNSLPTHSSSFILSYYFLSFSILQHLKFHKRANNWYQNSNSVTTFMIERGLGLGSLLQPLPLSLFFTIVCLSLSLSLVFIISSFFYYFLLTFSLFLHMYSLKEGEG